MVTNIFKPCGWSVQKGNCTVLVKHAQKYAGIGIGNCSLVVRLPPVLCLPPPNLALSHNHVL